MTGKHLTSLKADEQLLAVCVLHLIRSLHSEKQWFTESLREVCEDGGAVLALEVSHNLSPKVTGQLLIRRKHCRATDQPP